MKLSLQRIVFVSAFTLLALLKPWALYGQEFETASSDSVSVRNQEEGLYLNEDDRSLDHSPIPAKDSVLLKSSHHQRTKAATENPRQVDKRKDEKDDSIMSFNFLYYIIKKFKLSDIVDDE